MWFALSYLLIDIQVRTDVYIERLATFCMFLSAFLISASPALSVKAWTFFGFVVGHITWCIVAYKMKKWTLLEYNAGFLLLDIWAIGVRI